MMQRMREREMPYAQALFSPAPENYEKLADALDEAGARMRAMRNERNRAENPPVGNADGARREAVRHARPLPPKEAGALSSAMDWLHALRWGTMEEGPWHEMRENFRTMGEFACRLPFEEPRLAGVVADALRHVDGAHVREGRLRLELTPAAMLDLTTAAGNPLTRL